MKDIGAVLKNARENKEFTQKQVMELTGINKKSLSGYENNVAEPDLQTFATLINLYGLSADEVLEISTSTPSLLLSKKESSLLSTFNKLDFQHQEETLLLLRTLTKIKINTAHTLFSDCMDCFFIPFEVRSPDHSWQPSWKESIRQVM